MRFLLDTNVVSDLVRHPRGRIADRIAVVGEQQVCTSIIVAAEFTFWGSQEELFAAHGAAGTYTECARGTSIRTTVDAVYGALRVALERGGQPIGANDMLIGPTRCPSVPLW